MNIYDLKQLPKELRALNLRDGASVAFIFCENNDLVDRTVLYYLKRKFAVVCAFITEAEQYRERENLLCFKMSWEKPEDIWSVINSALPALRNKWLYWGYNGEFLYYPFSESRSINDLSEFLSGERRNTLFSYVIDLYTDDLTAHDSGVSMFGASFDLHNYYARPYIWPNEKTLEKLKDETIEERLVAVYGGLKWRFSELLPDKDPRIDRVAYFRVEDGLKFDLNGMTKDPEFHSYRCKFHHNTTGAVMSFHVARYLRHKPETRAQIWHFNWAGSERFTWRSEQLMRLGFMETGQWF